MKTYITEAEGTTGTKKIRQRSLFKEKITKDFTKKLDSLQKE
jgi:hypothetical protein